MKKIIAFVVLLGLTNGAQAEITIDKAGFLSAVALLCEHNVGNFKHNWSALANKTIDAAGKAGFTNNSSWETAIRNGARKAHKMVGDQDNWPEYCDFMHDMMVR